MIEKGGSPLELTAGPCSVNSENIGEIPRIAGIRVTNLQGESQPAIWGTRIVGLKSRTNIDLTGKGMGIDFPVFMENLVVMTNGGSVRDLITLPSIVMARQVVEETGMNVATEIMDPYVQLACYEREIPASKMLLWSPSVQQLSWPMLPMAVVAKRNNWQLGIKNGKWLGIPYEEAIRPDLSNKYDMRIPTCDMEKTWLGMLSFALSTGLKAENTILIHRGVTIPETGDMRGALVHEVAKHTKHSSAKGVKLFFDPSHSYGPKKRSDIVQGTIDAMLMRDGNNWLYDGALIEAGNSSTDTVNILLLMSWSV